LEREGKGAAILANAFHPGFVATEIFDKMENLPIWVVKLIKYVLDSGLAWNCDEGALTGLYLGVERDDLAKRNVRGRYYHPQAIEVDNPLANDEDLQAKLWEFSDSLVEKYLQQQ